MPFLPHWYLTQVIEAISILIMYADSPSYLDSYSLVVTFRQGQDSCGNFTVSIKSHDPALHLLHDLHIEILPDQDKPICYS